MIGSRTFSLMAVGFLAGCAASQCDPRTANLFSGIGCEVGGGYAQRAQGQQADLANSRAVSLQQRADADTAGKQAAAAEADVAARRRRVAALDAQTVTLRRQLAEAKRTHAADSAALQRAEAQFDALQQQRATMPDTPSEAQMDDLERQRTALADLLVKL